MSQWAFTETQHNRLGAILQSTFGIEHLRPFQADVLVRLLNARSALAVVSTGAGKSLCYQLPALFWDKPVLVISPLVALMHHQAERMVQLGVPAAALTGQLSAEAQRAILGDWRGGRLRLLYVAPERLSDGRLADALRDTPPVLLVVDEAHCISEWGYDFRPEYRRIREFRQRIGNPLLLALTATATERVKADIRWHLTAGGEALDLVEGPVDRPNLFLGVEMAATPKQQRERVRALVEHAAGGAIIYTGSRKGAERWASYLAQELSEPVRAYHAGLVPEWRRRIEREFVDGAVRVVASTTAFGMGIDRPDIRLVVHVDVPESLDSYYQEIGRAGRDGKPAEARLVTLPVDLYRRESWIRRDKPDAEWAAAVMERLSAQADHRPVVWELDEDDTQTAVVMAVLQDMGVLEVKSGPCTLRVVRSRDPRPHQEAVLYRLMQFWQRRTQLFEHMADYVESSSCRRAKILAYYGQASPQRRRCCDQCETQGGATVSPRADAPLVDRLRTWRARHAEAMGVEPFMILNDRDLMGLAAKRPLTLEALARCHGMGPKRMARYGQELLALMQISAEPALPASDEPLDQTAAQDRAVWLFQAGVPWDRVLEDVERSDSTVRGYFTDWVARSGEAEWAHYLTHWFSQEAYAEMAALMDQMGDGRLRPLFDAARARYRFDQWDVARAVYRRKKVLRTMGVPQGGERHGVDGRRGEAQPLGSRKR